MEKREWAGRREREWIGITEGNVTHYFCLNLLLFIMLNYMTGPRSSSILIGKGGRKERGWAENGQTGITTKTTEIYKEVIKQNLALDRGRVSFLRIKCSLRIHFGSFVKALVQLPSCQLARLS